MSTQANEMYAQVIVDVPALGCLDYRVPADMMVAVGDRVLVGLVSRTIPGVVVGLSDTTDVPAKKVRNIKAVLKETAPLRPEWLALTHFAAQYYVRTWGEAALPAIPVFFRRKPTTRHDSQLKKIRTLPEKKPALPSPSPELNREQLQAVETISQARGFAPYLLFGVTGSGKTEVYLQVIEQTLARDPQAQILLLVPEINLTPQLRARVQKRFPQQTVVSFNSECSDTERARAWLAAHEGRAQILVGTRMTIFASFKKLALIIVDEEHDSSFKAGDGLRYSARDLAVWRAAKNRIPVVLGSATPSLESWAKAKNGGYGLLELKKRAVSSATLPEVKLVSAPKKGNRASLTAETVGEIQAVLDQGKQALIFINRRGYSPVLSCPSCDWVSRCQRCSTFAVYHKHERALVCHHCGAKYPIPTACPKCGDLDIFPSGTGTERIEEELQGLFPEKKILRIDRDSVTRKNAAQKAFEKVHRGEVDILVGTQMIAKGHDFQNVALVVILNADGQLMSPDIRAKENLFSTLMQVSGRAGRHDGKGCVLIQTNMPTEPLFTRLEKHDFEGFADTVLNERQENWSIPYVYQALITAQAKTVDEALFFLNEIVKNGLAMAPADVRVYDPVPMSLVRLMNVERAQLLVEADSRLSLNRFIWQWQTTFPAISNITWTVEVDPLNI